MDIKLTPKEISFLSQMFSEKNQIGLFTNIKVPVDGTEQKSLEEKGIYTGGRLPDTVKEILKIAAKPRRCTRLILKSSSYIVEKYAYKADEKTVLAENDGGEMIFSVPDNFNKTIIELSEFTGMSNIKTTGIEVLLSADEALVLLAMIDISRKNALLSYAGQDTPDVITFKEIRQQLDTPAKNSLVKMLVNNYNYTLPKIENTKKLLESLVEKNIAELRNGYVLARDYAILGFSFLVPNTLAIIETFNANEGNQLATAGVLCVSAGLHDVLSFIFSEDEIEISTITGSYMLKVIENFLKCPDIT